MKKEIAPASMLRNEATEAELTRLGLVPFNEAGVQPVETWTYQAVERARIDRKKSLQNQARLFAPLDQANLNKIEHAVNCGKKLPAVTIFYDPTTETYTVGDGNHRYEKSEGSQFMNAYVVYTANDELRRRITNLANEQNGLPNSDDVRVGHAVNEVLAYGVAIDDAARLYNISRSKLRDELALHKFKQSFSNVPKSSGLEDTVKRAIADAIPKLTLTVANEVTRAAVENREVTANQIRDFASSYEKAASPELQEAIRKNMASHFQCAVRQKTNGGSIKGDKARKVLEPNEFMKLVQKLIAMLQKPQNNISGKLTIDQCTMVDSLGRSLVALSNNPAARKAG